MGIGRGRLVYGERVDGFRVGGSGDCQVCKIRITGICFDIFLLCDQIPLFPRESVQYTSGKK